jgi:hypothetical protein
MPQKILISSMRNPGKGIRPAISFCNSLLKPIIECSYLFLKSPQYLTNIKSLIELLFVILSTLNVVCKRIGRTCRFFVFCIPLDTVVSIMKSNDLLFFFYLLLALYKPRIV